MEDSFAVEKESLMDASKPLFYGFVFMAGVTMTISPAFAGTFLGIAVMAAISFVAAALSDSLNNDWQNFIEIISVVTLLSAVLAGSYAATYLSFVL